MEKKLKAALVAMILCLSMAGCGDTNEEEEPAETAATTTSAAATEAPETTTAAETTTAPETTTAAETTEAPEPEPEANYDYYAELAAGYREAAPYQQVYNDSSECAAQFILSDDGTKIQPDREDYNNAGVPRLEIDYYGYSQNSGFFNSHFDPDFDGNEIYDPSKEYDFTINSNYSSIITSTSVTGDLSDYSIGQCILIYHFTLKDNKITLTGTDIEDPELDDGYTKEDIPGGYVNSGITDLTFVPTELITDEEIKSGLPGKWQLEHDDYYTRLEDESKADSFLSFYGELTIEITEDFKIVSDSDKFNGKEIDFDGRNWNQYKIKNTQMVLSLVERETESFYMIRVDDGHFDGYFTYILRPAE
ncbi:MAG: hypothetical protein IJ737_01610 [Ruminococcus sp.]|nr:hypothetical protein [Ruminococcus sp.]